MAHRYFTQNILGEYALLQGKQAFHLTRVLRVKPGDILILCDGKGMDYEATVQTAGEEEVSLRIIQSFATRAEPNIQVHLFLGYSKADRMEWAIQKSIELGVHSITPFFSEKCIVRPAREEEKNKRMRRIAQAAAEQSGRGIVPEVHMPLTFLQMLQQARGFQPAFFFYEGGGNPLSASFPGSAQSSMGMALITGAEAGFTPEEARQAQQEGCTIAGLGPRILRCETAPVAALAAVMAFSGNLE